MAGPEVEYSIDGCTYEANKIIAVVSEKYVGMQMTIKYIVEVKTNASHKDMLEILSVEKLL